MALGDKTAKLYVAILRLAVGPWPGMASKPMGGNLCYRL